MSENTQLTDRRKRLSEAATEIDKISSSAASIFENQTGSFAQELQVAQVMVDMRTLLSDEVMAPVMALMNTDLGFRTDRDPTKPAFDGKIPTAYPMPVVREVFIEAKLRGFHTVGNEFNIIAGKFYGCQAGFKRKVKELTKGTYEASIDIPTMSVSADGKGLAKLKCRAKWKLNDQSQDIGIRPDDPCELSINVNRAMGVDAIIGKAERKLLKRVYERITGQIVPDGDADDSINVTATTQTANTEPKLTFGKAEDKKPETTAPTTAAAPAQTSTAPKTEPEPTPIQVRIANLMVAAGVSFDDFRDWLKNSGRHAAADSLGGYDEVPSALCTTLLADKSLSKCITLYGKKPVTQ